MAPGSAVMAGALDPQAMLGRFGAWAVLFVVFAEAGIPVLGVFLPGDTLLLPAGLACSAGVPPSARLPLALVLACGGAGSIAGAQTGFWLGRRGRVSLRHRGTGRRAGSRMARAEALFARYGPRRALVLGRFVPVVRTLVHPAAGLLGMPVSTFTAWQILAGLAWSQSMVLAGYALGESGRHGSAYLVPAVAAVLAVGLLPAALQWMRGRRAGRRPAPADRAPRPEESAPGASS
ncbi:DedA family protein [Actinacidiphila rubida]|uniref:Membrane-associated protein n=1 Tax=Actinacidiphila rubida TaxID=310780 RepID=A0A1H8K6V1_9ACTN|nr:DedA family protein [Actinacidiphila rubida]SEN88471.1 membrane-associated protein [Actinacidiphila rubida]